MRDSRSEFQRDMDFHNFSGGMAAVLLLLVLPVAFSLIITDYIKWSDKERVKEEAAERNRPKVILVHEGTEYEVEVRDAKP